MDAMPETPDDAPDFEEGPGEPTPNDAVTAAEWLEGRPGTAAALVFILRNPLASQKRLPAEAGVDAEEGKRLREAGLVRGVSEEPELYVVSERGRAAVIEAISRENRSGPAS